MASSVSGSSGSTSRSSGSTSRTSGGTTRASTSERAASTPSTRSTQTAQVGHSGVSSFSRGTGTRAATSPTAASRTPQKASTGSLRPGANGQAVRSLQDKLRASGFDPGSSDGKFGPRTERAVRDFQRSRGLEVDGIAGRRTFSALNGANGTAPGRPTPNGVNGTARLDNQPNARGLSTGSITVNGHTYQFNSGSSNLFSTPQGTYRVTEHRNSRSERAFVRDGVGFSFRLEDASRPNSDAMYDARAGRDRTALRIHPDGGARGTAGCIGVVGDGATMRQFRDDMNAELRRNGGAYTLQVR